MIEAIAERFPRTLEGGGEDVELRLMSADDETQVLEFARQLPIHDLLFLRRDITEPRVMAAWVRGIDAGRIVSPLAVSGGRILGCSAVVTDPHSFSRHVGDLRVLLDPEARARGLGRILIQECFLVALAMDLKKLTVQMTYDQQAAITVFEDMGFRPEALLKQQVSDPEGNLHDLVVLSHDVASVQAKADLYGMGELLGVDG